MTCVLGGLTVNVTDICRICLRKTKNLMDIYSITPEGEPSAAELIVIFGNTPVNERDGYPQQMCNTCQEKLQKCQEFRQKIRISFEILRRNITNDDSTIIKEDYYDDADTIIKQEDESEDDIPISPYLEVQVNLERKPDPLRVQKHRKSSKKVTRKKNSDKTDVNDEICATLQKLHKNRDKCPLCLQQPMENESMSEHFYSHYTTSDLTPLIVNGKKVKTCNLCDRQFRYNTMVPHHRMHLKVHPFRCEVEGCEKGFVTSQTLSIHLDQHTGVKKYQCKTCGKTFVLRSSLQNHEETHIFEYVDCKICHKTVKNSALLRIHMKRHSNGLKFKCKHPGCDKAFVVARELNRHTRSHTDVKTHTCEICAKSWFYESDLLRHMRYHATVRQHQCSQCSKTFVEKTQLKIHEMGHRGERPHVCEFCSTGFITSSTLKRHQMKHCKGAKDYAC